MPRRRRSRNPRCSESTTRTPAATSSVAIGRLTSAGVARNTIAHDCGPTSRAASNEQYAVRRGSPPMPVSAPTSLAADDAARSRRTTSSTPPCAATSRDSLDARGSPRRRRCRCFCMPVHEYPSSSARRQAATRRIDRAGDTICGDAEGLAGARGGVLGARERAGRGRRSVHDRGSRQALARHHSWDEVLAHRDDVPSEKRGPAWNDVVERAALGLVAAAPGGALGQLDAAEDYHERLGLEADRRVREEVPRARHRARAAGDGVEGRAGRGRALRHRDRDPHVRDRVQRQGRRRPVRRSRRGRR